VYICNDSIRDKKSFPLPSYPLLFCGNEYDEFLSIYNLTLLENLCDNSGALYDMTKCWQCVYYITFLISAAENKFLKPDIAKQAVVHSYFVLKLHLQV